MLSEKVKKQFPNTKKIFNHDINKLILLLWKYMDGRKELNVRSLP